MSLIKWRNRMNGGRHELARPVDQLRSEVDRLFNRFFIDPWNSNEGALGSLNTGEWMPSLDVEETDKEVTIRAEVPGVDPKELDIRIAGNVLTLSGEKKTSSEEKGENFYRTERTFGSFHRTVELPPTVDAEKVTAEHANGVVTIHVQKMAGATPKRITVKTEGGK